MSKIRYITILFIVILTSQSQAIITFQKTYGGIYDEAGGSVKQTQDGGFIILGTKGFPAIDSFAQVYLIKTDSLGDTLWIKTYGGDYSEGGCSIQQTFDGGFIIVAYTYSFGLGTPDLANIYLIKTNSFGDTVWTKVYGGTGADYGYSIQQTSDSGFIIAGTTSWDACLIKTNPSGDTMWTRTYGGPNDDEGCSVQQTKDGGFIMTGVGHFLSNYYIYLVKTDSSGDTVWTKTFGKNAYYNKAYSVQQTQDSGFIIAGLTEKDTTYIADVYLIRTNSLGDTIWTKTYGGTFDDKGYSVLQTQDGGFIIAGYTESFGAGKGDAYLIKTNCSGDILWTKTYGGADFDGGSEVQQTSDNGFIVVGVTLSFGAGDGDVYLIKTDSLGNVGVEEQGVGSSNQLSVKIGQNPFIKSTSIRYYIPVRSRISLEVYDLSGRCVKTLVDGTRNKGTYEEELQSTGLAVGIYFVKFIAYQTDGRQAGDYRETKKLVLMR